MPALEPACASAATVAASEVVGTAASVDDAAPSAGSSAADAPPWGASAAAAVVRGSRARMMPLLALMMRSMVPERGKASTATATNVPLALLRASVKLTAVPSAGSAPLGADTARRPKGSRSGAPS